MGILIRDFDPLLDTHNSPSVDWLDNIKEQAGIRRETKYKRTYRKSIVFGTYHLPYL